MFKPVIHWHRVYDISKDMCEFVAEKKGSYAKYVRACFNNSLIQIYDDVEEVLKLIFRNDLNESIYSIAYMLTSTPINNTNDIFTLADAVVKNYSNILVYTDVETNITYYIYMDSTIDWKERKNEQEN